MVYRKYFQQNVFTFQQILRPKTNLLHSFSLLDNLNKTHFKHPQMTVTPDISTHSLQGIYNNNNNNTITIRKEKWSWSLSLRLVYPVLHIPPGATITSRSAVRIRINFWRMVGLYISFGDWANALECWRSPSLRLVIPGIAVSPGVTHSDSRIVFVTGTVVKPQQPTNRNLQGSETGLPGTAYTAGSDRRFNLLAARFRINFWLDGWGSISRLEIGPMHLSDEGLRPWDWSYPVLQYLREWPTPTFVSSLSRVLSLNTNHQESTSQI